MIKRTIYFGNPCYLSTKDEQLVIEQPNPAGLPKSDVIKTIPIEDIGVVVLDHQQLTISQAVIHKLMANNVALITCDNTHHPTGMLLNLDGNTLQSERFRAQIDATLPLKKQLWQQTIKAKLTNQAHHLREHGIDYKPLLHWADEVLSGDGGGHEGRGAAFYWRSMSAVFYSKNEESSSFRHPELDSGSAEKSIDEQTQMLKQVQHDGTMFFRRREGEPPNNLLNYGYAILRACVARSLVGSGLVPTLGIHHRNQYNAYCLADDIMEPYRPFVDRLVATVWNEMDRPLEINKDIKGKLLNIPTLDVSIDGQSSPLMVALHRTTSSLVGCYDGTQRKVLYPIL